MALIKTSVLSVLFSLGLPQTLLAAGSVTSEINALHINYAIGDILFVWVAGAVSGAPACSTGTNYQFAVDLSTAMGQQTMALLLSARATGTSVTIYGTGACNLYGQVETLSYLVY